MTPLYLLQSMRWHCHGALPVRLVRSGHLPQACGKAAAGLGAVLCRHEHGAEIKRNAVEILMVLSERGPRRVVSGSG